MILSRKELDVLVPAVLYGWTIEYDRMCRNAKWEGDTMLPFRAHKTAEKLAAHGYLWTIPGVYKTFKATTKALSLRCTHCHRGRVFDDDVEVGSCERCGGLGLLQPTPTPPDPGHAGG